MKDLITNMTNRALIDALNITLESDRLCLIPIEAYHAQLLFSAMQDPSIYTWISSTPPTSVVKLEEWWSELENRLLTTQDVLYLNWAVQRKFDGMWVGKMDVDINSDNIAINIGYLFFPPFWGQGYATESVRLLSDHLSHAGIVEQRALVTFGNTASTKVLESAGFLKTRIIKENDILRGVLVDDIEYIRRG
jgi:[ribosomal protein S5]-alanine N-acetyltransferase